MAGSNSSSRSPGLICELAASGPLLVLLEDVPWADQSSRDLLRYLRARLTDGLVVVIASYRADDLHRRHPLACCSPSSCGCRGSSGWSWPLPDADVGALVRGCARRSAGAQRRRRRRPRRGQCLLRRGAARRGAAGEACRSGSPTSCSPCRAAALRPAGAAGRCCRRTAGAAPGCSAAVVPWRPAELERLWRTVPGPCWSFRRRSLPVPPRAAPRGGTRRPPAGRARAAARRGHGLPCRRPGGGTAAERAHHPRESNDLPGHSAPPWKQRYDACSVGAPAERLRRLEAALALGSRSPTRRRAWASQVELLLEPAAARTGGELPVPSPCCGGLSTSSARMVIRSAGPGCRTLAQVIARSRTDAGAGRESLRRMAPSARRSRRRRFVPGRRRRRPVGY